MNDFLEAIVTSPAFAAYGLYRIVLAIIVVVRKTKSTLLLLGHAIPCLTCQTRNEIHGRWLCTCGATYLGPVFECSHCHVGAAFFDCSRCGASIPLPR